MKVATLKTQLQGASGSTFSLAAGALDVAGVKILIQTHLGGTLTINNSKPDVTELTVEGLATIDSLQNRPVKVWFSTDATAENVTGLLIAYQPRGWSIATSFYSFDGSYLNQYPTFTSLALVLSARPEDETNAIYGYGPGVYVVVAGKPLLLHGCLPTTIQRSQKADITLRGEFSGFSLGDLDKLAGFIGGYKFTGLLPGTIPLADEFELRSAWFVVNPNLQFITAVGLEVRSVHPWVLIKGKFEFDYLDISFMMNVPDTSGTKEANSTVYWTITTEMKIDDSVKIVTGIDSDLTVSAELLEPVPIKPILNRYFPAADLDFTVDGLRIELTFADKPPDWYIYLAVDTPWQILDGVKLDSIQFSADGKGTTPQDVKLNAQLTLGDAELYLGGALNKGAGWDFSGKMSHDYNVQIVPNPDFNPTAPPTPAGRTSFNVEHVPNNPSHFFQQVSDKHFPGSSASGVPPLLDVDIKKLEIEFNTQTKDFHFDTEIEFGKDVDTVLTFSNLHQAGAEPLTFEKRATGVITVFPGTPDEFAFDLGIDLKPDSKHFVALYNNTANKPLKLGDLVKAMFPSVDVTAIPNFSITIKDGIVGYVSEKQGDANVSQSVFVLDMDASLDLSQLGNIPLIGKSLSAAKTLTLAFRLLYSPDAGKLFTTADLIALNELITVAGPQFPTDQPISGVNVKTELRVGASAPIDFSLPVKIDQTSGQLTDNGQQFTPPPGSQPTDDGVKWFQLNEQFGPVHLQRAGFKFENGKLTALLDGGLTALGLEVDLMGLSVTSQITDVEHGQFKPEFGLQGLGLSFSKGGVGFTGALFHLKDEYDGLANVEAEGLRLAAIGSLREVNNQTSLFLYAVLDYALGGSPFFYITGLAGGFGLNQKLIMPAVDQVNKFPLVQAALNPPKVPTDPGSAGSFINTEMQAIRNSLTPNIGQYFGCAGIHFTSFELLDSFLLISISFGREFELDLIGVSTLVVPPQLPESEPPIAKVSLQIVGSFIPNEGIAIVQGRLTADSHILDPDCHLTGGFAFATWFGSNPHAGDFVITLGGYHPDFQKPSHYPAVPRIGVNWKISTELSVTGGIYFALTPRALMAGGAMRAVFQTSLDLVIATVDVKAWFILGADFIVYWKPFHYSASLYIDIGIDVVIHFLGTHELSLEAGADLQVWGPRFGGHAHVFVKVIGIKIGFDVEFGASAPKPLPLDWDNEDPSKSFKQSFLPKDDKIVSVAISEGLVRKVDVASKQADSNTEDIRYVINAKDFRVRTSSVIPIKNINSDIKSGQDLAGNKSFGIAPMAKGANAVDTFHQIKITRNNLSADSSFSVSPIKSNVPGGLWAEENTQDVNAPGLIENAVVGFEIVPATSSVPGHTKSIPRGKLAYTTHPVPNAYKDVAIRTFSADPVVDNNLWTRIQKEIHMNTTRDQMLADLGFAKADFDIGEPFTTDAAYAPSYGHLSS